ncbi:TetR family transcriptional regulator [Virgibacillus phasianinus]|uniref:TetR family transcriptional regulator n=1 Tax=Virgibacillus phasianinus TaxID=2017483 RepID=A0A220U2D7_9BACI|nr:TetR/AcrR family transcriptional regulator [Virgibacillus phasianinus]ASK62318.1 TetR family transcriptional regulator [Virgibacillus phasianinus]
MNATDLRVIKTKKALSTALFNLLEKYTMSSITVNMICNESLVHRTTFYKHFYDKYDLLIYLFKSFSKDYFELDLKDRINSPFTSISYIINTRIDKISKRQKNDRKFYDTLANYFVDVFQNDIKENANRFSVDSKVPNDLIIYIYGANLQAIMDWNRNNNVEKSSEELDKIFHKVVNLKIKN